jgi:hypothetical protein
LLAVRKALRLSGERQPQDTLKVKIIYATTVDLAAAVFPWAKFRTHKRAIKLHTVLTEMLPQCVIVTDGKTRNRQAVQDLHFEPGDLLIIDRAYLDYAELYRRLAEIELFFKWIKQNLKIKAFYGTSKNAVLIQVWTALIAYLLLVWLKFKSKVGWGLLELTRLAQTMFLERCDRWAVFCPPSPDKRQPLLFN